MARWEGNESILRRLAEIDARDKAAARDALAARVDADIKALTRSLRGFRGGAEWPTADTDLSSYRDAYAEAVRTCPHRYVQSTTYAWGEYQCRACGKYVTSEDMERYP